jgi:hypothetical protein
VAVLHFLGDPQAHAVVDTIKQAVPPGSCLIISHATADNSDEEQIKTVQDVYGGRASAPLTMRTLADASRFFDGLELVGPVIDINAWWNPAGETTPATACYGGVGIKAYEFRA